MSNLFLRKKGRSFLIPVCYLILIWGFSGCKKDEETVSGKWQITTYKVEGIDSLEQIGRLHLEGILSLAAADGEKTFFNNFMLQTSMGDTTFSFHGTWDLEEKAITLNPNAFFKAVYQKYLYSFNSTTTNQNQPYPVLFPLAGRWNIKKQGRNSLELKKEANKEIELHLRRQ